MKRWISLGRTIKRSIFESTSEGMCDAEMDLGIISFANQSVGFNGIIKQRYSDFIVREINKVTLHNIQPSQFIKLSEFISFCSEIKQGIPAMITDTSAGKFSNMFRSEYEMVPDIERKNAFIACMKEKFSLDDVEGLESFITKCLSKDPTCPNTFLAFPCDSKLLRTTAHSTVRQFFGVLMIMSYICTVNFSSGSY